MPLPECLCLSFDRHNVSTHRPVADTRFLVGNKICLLTTSQYTKLKHQREYTPVRLDVTSMAFDVTACNGAEVDKRPVRCDFCGVVAVGWSAREETYVVNASNTSSVVIAIAGLSVR